MERKAKLIRVVVLAALVLTLAVVSTASMAQQPEGVQPDSVACGDNINCSTSGWAVDVKNSGTGAKGIRGWSNPGVLGKSNAGSGVKGTSANGVGVYAESANGTGLLAEGGLNQPSIVVTENGDDDGLISSDPNAIGSDLLIRSNDVIYLYLDYNENEEADFRIYDGTAADPVQFRVDDAANGSWYGRWEAGAHDLNIRSRDDMFMHVNDLEDGSAPGCFQILAGDDSVIESWCDKGPTHVGTDMVVAGSVSSLASTSQGDRLLSGVQSPSAWVEDFGSGQLVDGVTVVSLDGLFLETVNAAVGFHVFLTPLGDSNGLYVTNKGPSSFEVREQGGGTSSIAFDYRVVAKRLSFENLRLEAYQQGGTDGEDFPTAPPKALPLEEDGG